MVPKPARRTQLLLLVTQRIIVQLPQLVLHPLRHRKHHQRSDAHGGRAAQSHQRLRPRRCAAEERRRAGRQVLGKQHHRRPQQPRLLLQRQRHRSKALAGVWRDWVASVAAEVERELQESDRPSGRHPPQGAQPA
jgi:hypothetical protein